MQIYTMTHYSGQTAIAHQPVVGRPPTQAEAAGLFADFDPDTDFVKVDGPAALMLAPGLTQPDLIAALAASAETNGALDAALQALRAAEGAARAAQEFDLHAGDLVEFAETRDTIRQTKGQPVRARVVDFENAQMVASPRHPDERQADMPYSLRASVRVLNADGTDSNRTVTLYLRDFTGQTDRIRWHKLAAEPAAS